MLQALPAVKTLKWFGRVRESAPVLRVAAELRYAGPPVMLSEE